MARELVALARYQVPPAIRVSFQGPEELMCRLPEPRLRQCLLNLILNAAEAVGREEGAIRIEARQDDGRIELTVTDSGPGFPAGLLLDGIRPFATGRVGGTGLGLAMVQRFVRDLGGQLSLANVEPHGASVRLSLPLRAG
jgi:C4-dicarboxylate-specific signal transduction histidine kinase